MKKYKILINSEQRGVASNKDELIELLTSSEIKKIFDHEAYRILDDVFTLANTNPNKDTFLMDLKGITANMITNGYQIVCIDFYL